MPQCNAWRDLDNPAVDLNVRNPTVLWPKFMYPCYSFNNWLVVPPVNYMSPVRFHSAIDFNQSFFEQSMREKGMGRPNQNLFFFILFIQSSYSKENFIVKRPRAFCDGTYFAANIGEITEKRSRSARQERQETTTKCRFLNYFLISFLFLLFLRLPPGFHFLL